MIIAPTTDIRALESDISPTPSTTARAGAPPLSAFNAACALILQIEFQIRLCLHNYI